MLTLLVEDTDAGPARLGGAVITLGRIAGNDLVLADARISSRHGRLVRHGGGYAFEDLGSRNGSLVERAGGRTVCKPHQPVPVAAGDRLLLGDLQAPVVVRIVEAPASGAGSWAGGTVVARRSVADPDAVLADEGADVTSLRALFALLRDLSGRVEPDEVLGRIADAVLARFPHACAVSVLQRTPGGTWITESARARGAGGAEDVQPSSTLLERAVGTREVVAYVPDSGGPASVAGLAGTVLVPLLAGEECIGVLHVDSKKRPFLAADLGWLSVVGTHAAASLAVARRFRALAQRADELTSENRALEKARRLPRPILGDSAALTRALDQLSRVAGTTATVLISGETGTGKELAARYVHALSKRSDGAFCAINCAALPENLLSSELFGHRKGAFTGAVSDRKGLFEAAGGGTVFLDEIGEVSEAVQLRLLRVLQEREVQPVGASAPIKVDVRIIAATNRDLPAMVQSGGFREDLYYRLAIFPVRLPSLRERQGDVDLLAERFREAFCARHDKWIAGFAPDALAALRACPWPGNVRQLEHEVERAVILADEGSLIGLGDLSDQVVERSASSAAGPAVLPEGDLRAVMAELEEQVIRRELDRQGGNRTRAAEVLGISRQALQVKLAKWREREDG